MILQRDFLRGRFWQENDTMHSLTLAQKRLRSFVSPERQPRATTCAAYSSFPFPQFFAGAIVKMLHLHFIYSLANRV